MNNVKISRYNHSFTEEISKILANEMKDDSIKFVSITGCDISSDLSYAKVYFTVLNQDDKEQTTIKLNEASSYIRGKLSSKVEIRHTPELKFIYDESIAYGEHIEEVLNKLKENSKEE